MWIGEQEVRASDPAAMPLYLDIDGNITETGGSNFVIYRDGKVISPRHSNILLGHQPNRSGRDRHRDGHSFHRRGYSDLRCR